MAVLQDGNLTTPPPFDDTLASRQAFHTKKILVCVLLIVFKLLTHEAKVHSRKRGEHELIGYNLSTYFL